MEPAVQSKDPAAEAAVKMRTDCVYFLASPLTCKKGIKCEYRHSEAARLNPRDCWYWVNRKCLNPNCSFRHPPLEAFLESGGTVVTREPPSALSQPVSSMTMPAPFLAPAQGWAVGGAPQVASKQSVPCYYFQQGYCKKAETCPFLHGPQPAIGTLPPSQLPKTFDQISAETDTVRRAAIKTSMTSNSSQDHQATSLRLTHSLSTEQNRSDQSNHVSKAQGTNGLKSGKILRRSSPSFDVLVDTADEKLHNDAEEFCHKLDNGRRHLNSVVESQYNNFSNFDDVAKYDEESYKSSDRPDLERNGHLYSLRRSSETSIRRALRRPRSPEETRDSDLRDSDLRNRLSKRRRIEGVSRSDNGHLYERERGHTVRPRYDDRSGRDQHSHFNSVKSRISSCLQGRLKLTSEVYNGRSEDLRRSNKVEQNGFSHSRTRQSVSAAVKHKIFLSRRQDTNKSADFTAPKTLAELKGAKESVRGEGPTSENNELAAGSDVSVDCPKPMKILFQRKQENIFYIDETDSSTAEANSQVGTEDVKESNDPAAVLRAEPGAPPSLDEELGKVNDTEAGVGNQVGEEAFEEEECVDYNEDGEYESLEVEMEVEAPKIEAYTNLRAQ